MVFEGEEGSTSIAPFRARGGGLPPEKRGRSLVFISPKKGGGGNPIKNKRRSEIVSSFVRNVWGEKNISLKRKREKKYLAIAIPCGEKTRIRKRSLPEAEEFIPQVRGKGRYVALYRASNREGDRPDHDTALREVDLSSTSKGGKGEWPLC